SSRRRHTRFSRDWSSDVCSSDLLLPLPARFQERLAARLEAAVQRNQDFQDAFGQERGLVRVAGGEHESVQGPGGGVVTAGQRHGSGHGVAPYWVPRPSRAARLFDNQLVSMRPISVAYTRA